MKIFAQNKYNVAKHNQLYERGEVSFRLGINKFSDMTLRQFARINGYRRAKRYHTLDLLSILPMQFVVIVLPSVNTRKKLFT